MTVLKIDVSEAWDGDSPIVVPEYNKDSIPKPSEVVSVLEYFMKNHPLIFDSILTFSVVESFLLKRDTD